MKTRMSKARIYMMRGFTIKAEGGKFYVAPSIAYQNKLSWSRPYKSLQHAASAIARKIQADFAKRDGSVSP